MIAGKYDVIGDIHGHAEELRRLLQDMGYSEDDGVFRHRDRRVIFVGDFIDRGPEQCEVLRIARSMCDAGTRSPSWAIMNSTHCAGRRRMEMETF